jgi:3-vinyl bacteriochlorophyllide hydratase
MFAETAVNRWLTTVDASPWGAVSGRAAPQQAQLMRKRNFLYTPEERRRRDASPWTMVQGVLAPVQFAVFLMSLVLVVRFMMTGEGLTAATASVVVKTVTLYTIMVTGAIWERQVFGRYLFAPAFYWEDVFSMLVLGLHTAYLAALFSGVVKPRDLMLLALAAYTSYVVNATQFVLKLRAARLEGAAGGALAVSGNRTETLA